MQGITKIGEKLNDPNHTVKIIIDTGMPVNRYKVLADFNKFKDVFSL